MVKITNKIIKNHGLEIEEYKITELLKEIKHIRTWYIFRNVE